MRAVTRNVLQLQRRNQIDVSKSKGDFVGRKRQSRKRVVGSPLRVDDDGILALLSITAFGRLELEAGAGML